MKKTLAALAVLGAFAGSAAAADVTLYGVLDQALSYTYKDVKGFDGVKTVDGQNTFEMASGINAGSRFGLKGVEELGNGYKVGFKLENGFNGDDGTLSSANRLFHREAALTVYGPYGELAFGRMGGIGSAAGTYDLVAYYDAFDGGDNKVFGFNASDRYDNMVTYATPRIAGLQAVAQYSFKTDSKSETGTEGESTAERYASFGVTGEYGPAQFVVGYELTKYSTLERLDTPDLDDGQLVFVGGNYDFGVAKLFIGAQYFDGAQSATAYDLDQLSEDVYGKDSNVFRSQKGFKGYGVHLGTIAPLGEGELTVGAYYVNAKLQDAYTHTTGNKDYALGDIDTDYLGLAARYCYPLSKRTTVYVGGGYAEATMDAYKDAVGERKDKVGNAYLGLTHTF